MHLYDSLKYFISINQISNLLPTLSLGPIPEDAFGFSDTSGAGVESVTSSVGKAERTKQAISASWGAEELRLTISLGQYYVYGGGSFAMMTNLFK